MVLTAKNMVRELELVQVNRENVSDLPTEHARCTLLAVAKRAHPLQ
jgi:hypothetical protein